MAATTGIKDITEIAQIAGKHLDLSVLPDFERAIILNTLQESSDEEGLTRAFAHLMEFFSFDALVAFYSDLFGEDAASAVLYCWKNDIY